MNINCSFNESMNNNNNDSAIDIKLDDRKFIIKQDIKTCCAIIDND